jgi:uncharacterized protein YjbI with pentapeptide repeats
MLYKDKIFGISDIKGESFTGDQFIGCSFHEVSMRFTTFETCVFRECDLSSADYGFTSFSRCQFPESKLSGIDFSEINLEKLDFFRLDYDQLHL